MINKVLKEQLDKLLVELSNSDGEKTNRLILAKAVQLGMKYQEQKIREGINIVFSELNK